MEQVWYTPLLVIFSSFDFWAQFCLFMEQSSSLIVYIYFLLYTYFKYFLVREITFIRIVIIIRFDLKLWKFLVFFQIIMNASICACDCDCVTYPSFFGRMGIQKMCDALTLSPQEVLSIMYSNSMSFFKYYSGQISWERLVKVTQVCIKFFPISLVF